MRSGSITKHFFFLYKQALLDEEKVMSAKNQQLRLEIEKLEKEVKAAEEGEQIMSRDEVAESKVGSLRSPVSRSVVVRKSNAEVEAMRRQSKGLAQEYDRLLTEHHQLQVHICASI